MVFYVVCGGILICLVFLIVYLFVSYQKRERNPVLLMLNHDKRFEKIDSIYAHKIFDIRRGN